MGKGSRRLKAKEKSSKSRWLGSPLALWLMIIFGPILVTMLVSYILTFVWAVIDGGKLLITQMAQHLPVSWGSIFRAIGHTVSGSSFANVALVHQHFPSWMIVEATALTAIVYLIGRVWFRYHVRNYSEYGDAHWTDNQEVKKEYPRVPDRNTRYEGVGGVPIMHTLKFTNAAGLLLSNKMDPQMVSKTIIGMAKLFPKPLTRRMYAGYYFIDQSTVNSLIVGITRSGKGETFVNVLVALLARAREQSSMVINDPKGELSQMAYKFLRRMGYDVEILNLLDMNYSMSYNPLQVIIDFAQRGYYDKVQQYVRSLATAVYAKPNDSGGDSGNSQFWTDSSVNLLQALILALIDNARRDDAWDKVTMRNCVKMMTILGGDEVPVDVSGHPTDDPDEIAGKKSKLSLYFESFLTMPKDRFRSMALDAFQQSNFAGQETAGSIYSSTLQGLQLYQQDDVGQLTSKNSIDLTSVGFSRRFRMHFKTTADGHNPYRFKFANVKILDDDGQTIEKRSANVDVADYLDFPIEHKLPDYFRVAVDFDNDRNSGAIRNSTVLIDATKAYKRKGFGKDGYENDEYDHQPIISHIVVKQQLSHMLVDLDKTTFVYSDRPKAVFLVTPPNNPAYNPLVSFFVDQVFNLNYELALQSGRKVFRRLHFILDEFGNLPAINDMDKKVSIGLGQNILFDIVVQNLEQLSAIYGKERGATIQSNCGNFFYILTKSTDTAETIVKMLGKRTVDVNRVSGNVGQLRNMHDQDNAIGQDLLSVTDLLNFKDGEMLLMRSTTRRDKKHKLIEPRPIYDVGVHAMPSRWMFMNKEFDQSTTMSDIPIHTPHQGLDLETVAVDFPNAYDQVIAESQEALGSPDDGVVGDTGLPPVDGDNDEYLFSPEELADQQRFESINNVFSNMLSQIIRETDDDSRKQQLLDLANQLRDLRRQTETLFWEQPLHNQLEWLENVLGNDNLVVFKRQVEELKMNILA